MNAPETLDTDTRLKVLTHFLPESAGRVLLCGPSAQGIAAVLKSRGSDPHLLPGNGLEDAPVIFEDGPYDAILCEEDLATLRDHEPAVKTLHAALAPGGVLVLVLPNLQYHRHFLAFLGGEWPCGIEQGLAASNLRFFTGYEIVSMLRRNGFTGTKLSGLEFDDPEAFPKDASGHVHIGRATLGPLSDDEHRAFLIRTYVAVAQKAAVS